jgi:hypothetical protein
MNSLLMLIGAFVLAVAIYNITQNKVEGALVTNALLVAIGGGLMYFAYSK